MVFRNEAPITRVGRTVTIVALHPIVVHLEGIGICLISINKDITIGSDLQLVSLVFTDATLIYRQILKVQRYAGSFGRNPYWSVVVNSPMLIAIQGIQVVAIVLRQQLHAEHKVLTLTHSLSHLGCKRTYTTVVEVAIVGEGQTNLTNEVLGQRGLCQFHLIEILNIIGLFIGLSIEIDDAVLDF